MQNNVRISNHLSTNRKKFKYVKDHDSKTVSLGDMLTYNTNSLMVKSRMLVLYNGHNCISKTQLKIFIDLWIVCSISSKLYLQNHIIIRNGVFIRGTTGSRRCEGRRSEYCRQKWLHLEFLCIDRLWFSKWEYHQFVLITSGTMWHWHCHYIRSNFSGKPHHPIKQHTDMRDIGVPNFLSSVSCTKINNFSSTNIKYWERV